MQVIIIALIQSIVIIFMIVAFVDLNKFWTKEFKNLEAKYKRQRS